MKIDRGRLNKLLTVERSIPDDRIEGAGADTWVPVTKVWAEIEDGLPSRGERLAASGVTVSQQPARVRIDVQDGITGDMRFVLGSRVMEIVAGPAHVNDPEAMEFMTVDFGSGGGA